MDVARLRVREEGQRENGAGPAVHLEAHLEMRGLDDADQVVRPGRLKWQLQPGAGLALSVLWTPFDDLQRPSLEKRDDGRGADLGKETQQKHTWG